MVGRRRVMTTAEKLRAISETLAKADKDHLEECAKWASKQLAFIASKMEAKT